MPDEFYSMEKDDYMLMRQGFLNGQDKLEGMFRKHAFSLLAAWVKQVPNPYNFWPIQGDKKVKEWHKEINKEKTFTIDERNMETLRKFKELEQKQKAGKN